MVMQTGNPNLFGRQCHFRWFHFSWGLTYNLFGDKLLGLGLFPQDIYATREFSRHNLLSAIQGVYHFYYLETAWYKTVVRT
jgi:hypothetical protein